MYIKNLKGMTWYIPGLKVLTLNDSNSLQFNMLFLNDLNENTNISFEGSFFLGMGRWQRKKEEDSKTQMKDTENYRE